MSAPQPFSPRRRAPASPPPQRIRPNTSPSRRPVGIQIPHAASSTCLNDAADSSAPAGPVDLTGESHVEHSNMAVTQDSSGTSTNFRIRTGVSQPRRTPMAGDCVVTFSQPVIRTTSIRPGARPITSIGNNMIQSGQLYSRLLGRRSRSISRRPRSLGPARSIDTNTMLSEVDGSSPLQFFSAVERRPSTPLEGHRYSGNGHFFNAGLCSDPLISRFRAQRRPCDISAQLAKSNRTPD